MANCQAIVLVLQIWYGLLACFQVRITEKGNVFHLSHTYSSFTSLQHNLHVNLLPSVRQRKKDYQ